MSAEPCYARGSLFRMSGSRGAGRDEAALGVSVDGASADCDAEVLEAEPDTEA